MFSYAVDLKTLNELNKRDDKKSYLAKHYRNNRGYRELCSPKNLNGKISLKSIIYALKDVERYPLEKVTGEHELVIKEKKLAKEIKSVCPGIWKEGGYHPIYLQISDAQPLTIDGKKVKNGLHRIDSEDFFNTECDKIYIEFEGEDTPTAYNIDDFLRAVPISALETNLGESQKNEGMSVINQDPSIIELTEEEAILFAEVVHVIEKIDAKDLDLRMKMDFPLSNLFVDQVTRQKSIGKKIPVTIESVVKTFFDLGKEIAKKYLKIPRHKNEVPPIVCVNNYDLQLANYTAVERNIIRFFAEHEASRSAVINPSAAVKICVNLQGERRDLIRNEIKSSNDDPGMPLLPAQPASTPSYEVSANKYQQAVLENTKEVDGPLNSCSRHTGYSRIWLPSYGEWVHAELSKASSQGSRATGFFSDIFCSFFQRSEGTVNSNQRVVPNNANLNQSEEIKTKQVGRTLALKQETGIWALITRLFWSSNRPVATGSSITASIGNNQTSLRSK